MMKQYLYPQLNNFMIFLRFSIWSTMKEAEITSVSTRSHFLQHHFLLFTTVIPHNDQQGIYLVAQNWKSNVYRFLLHYRELSMISWHTRLVVLWNQPAIHSKARPMTLMNWLFASLFPFSHLNAYLRTGSLISIVVEAVFSVWNLVQ